MSKNAIVINRGDTHKFEVIIEDDTQTGGKYILKNDDALYFGLMDPHQPFEFALVKKKYTKEDVSESGSINIKIDASDTLDLLPGKYYYAIKLHKLCEAENIDEVLTIINKTKFIICD